MTNYKIYSREALIKKCIDLERERNELRWIVKELKKK